QTITAGFSTPELFVVAQDLTKMQIEAKVSEADVVKIKEGQEAEFTLDGYPDEKFKGTIRQVRTNYSSSSNNSSSSNTTYTVVIDVDNTDGKFMPGMTATISINVNAKKDVLLVKNEALRFSPSNNKEKYTTTGVWVMERGAQEPKRVDVTIGIISDKVTEIKSGDVKAGQMVVVSESKEGITPAAMGMGRPGGGGGRRR
ncbi:MAG: efflux RND transporter periplasmic adaptor subunit, partial [Elusimicrobiaceae bacterium]|nr:efflux RND transporter periplasmic adaptor subunit [Elusimicrobiaceae bacterium]